MKFWIRNPDLVSVIINFYNAERFLAEAIESVLAQSHRPIEIILVDDGSTDASRAIAERYAGPHAFIRCVQHEGRANRGMSASRNLGLRHCRGAFVGFLDADDVWVSYKLERELQLFRENPQAAMICSATLIWFSWTSDLEELVQIARQPRWKQGQPEDRVRFVAKGRWEGMVRPPGLLRMHLRRRNSLPHTISALVRRRAALKVGGFEEAFPTMYDDQAFFSKLALTEPVYVTKEWFSKYRQHGDSICNRARRAGDWAGEAKRPGATYEAYLRWLVDYVEKNRPRDGRTPKFIREQIEVLEQ